MDVHAQSIAVAVAETGGAVRSLGTIPNRLESIRKFIKKRGKAKEIRVCYEAGPTGYELYWQLTEMGVHCDVIAPTLIPVKTGDRVKTDRRDAEKLARCYSHGDLTPVWVPDHAHEALRDLVRCRLAAKRDERRAKQRLQKLLLRHGRRPPVGARSWNQKYQNWLLMQQFEQPALQATLEDYRHEMEHHAARLIRLEKSIDDVIADAPASIRAVIEGLQTLRGVAKTVAVGVVAELGEFSRFDHPSKLMAYSGIVPREYSTGGPGKHRRGSITKSGNTHIRRFLVESAWAYRHQAKIGPVMRKRQANQPAKILEISWQAQQRLCGRYRKMVGSGKERQKVITAIARELLGFMWAIGVEIERSVQIKERKKVA